MSLKGQNHNKQCNQDNVKLSNDLKLDFVILHFKRRIKHPNMKSQIINEKKEDKSQKWVLPTTSMSEEEFLSGIRNAEEGNFHTVQESIEKFEIWMKSKERK